MLPSPATVHHQSFPVENILSPRNEPVPKRRHKIILVLPAYNAESTLAATLADVPAGAIDDVILVDDGSRDRTVHVAREMGLSVFEHPRNRGYGGNQKTCYRHALEHGADIIVMIHPDYQYDSRVIPHAVGFLELGICDIVLGSRIRSRHEALAGGMPLYKYLSNRFLTAVENLALGKTWATFTAASASTGAQCSNASLLNATPMISCSIRSSWSRRYAAVSGSATSPCRCAISRRPAVSLSGAV